MSHFGSTFTSHTSARAMPGALLAAFVAAAAAGGCAQQRGQQEANAAVAEPKPQPAYCQASPAPDCRFRNASLRTMDPAEFARLKLAYERRCIRRAEKIERERMRELQAAGACEGRSVPSLAASR